MAMTAGSDEREDAGQLANNFILVQGLYSTLKRAETNSNLVPKQVARIIAEDAWRAWLNPESGRRFGEGFDGAADFRNFIRKPWPDGCGSSIELVERQLQGTAAWLKYVEVIGGNPGGLRENQPRDERGRLDRITDIIRNADDPNIIPLPQRDRSNDLPGGTSRIAAIRRLVKEGRTDLIERIEAGDMTPHSATVAAGFRRRSITVDDDPERAARRLLRHFHGDRLAALIAALSEGLS